MNDSIKNLSYNIFSDTANKIKDNFADIKRDLQNANMNYTLVEYLSVVILVITITFFSETLILTFIFSILGIGILGSLILALLLSFSITGGLLFMFYSYPATVAKNRGSLIERSLPFAVSYMSVVAAGDVQPTAIFETLSDFEEYGEITKAAKKISHNVRIFGMTLSSAIRRQAERVPSRRFKEILWGIENVISTGGDLVFFLTNRSQELMNDYRRSIRKYSQDLSLFVEIYLTLIIAGSVFFIVLSTIIASMSGGLGMTNIQGLVTLILLPGISIAFILMIKAISPTG